MGISFSGDIEKKYGQAIYKVGSYARKAFMERHIKQGIAEGKVYILYEKDGVFNFCPRGETFNGKLIEYVWF